ncbi:CHAP domain-containing protein [Leucobacter viscericola]|uniref:CHAP domain-containing protein n=1 Tax=Leucobacter viscericola TaxID=2714935 RepID=A0A6G7XF74_9MICO|nr:CHAP domain-containing protein [Leucobacter viscericola]QIK63028.1 CHAP domain-containing protein [Leucobacter viscericola]
MRSFSRPLVGAVLSSVLAASLVASGLGTPSRATAETGDAAELALEQGSSGSPGEEPGAVTDPAGGVTEPGTVPAETPSVDPNPTPPEPTDPSSPPETTPTPDPTPTPTPTPDPPAPPTPTPKPDPTPKPKPDPKPNPTPKPKPGPKADPKPHPGPTPAPPAAPPVAPPTPQNTSDSPGLETVRPSGGIFDSPIVMNLGALRGKIIGDNYPSYYRNLPWPYSGAASVWDRWNFAYRQCTSFVAWRLNTANGVPFSNQYLGVARWGNAGQWADSARSVGIRVDNVPEVGAVAWSGPNYRDASEFGHVAWVAKVLGKGKIVIEEYNYGWGGAYHSRVVDSNEFQGYIHIKDIKDSFSKAAAPVVEGTAMVGGKLTASVAGWKPAPTNVQYQWKRNGIDIAGATAKTYEPTKADLGSSLSVEVVGDRAGFSVAAKNSKKTDRILLSDENANGVEDAQERFELHLGLKDYGRAEDSDSYPNFES